MHVSSYNISEDVTPGKMLKINFEILTMSKETVLYMTVICVFPDNSDFPL